MLTPREIIAQAWTITTTERTLKAWGFCGSLLRLLLDVKLVSYQIYFVWAYFKGMEVGLLDDFIWLNETVSQPVFWTILISFLVLLGMELILPSFVDGAIIGLSAKAKRKEPLQGGLILGLYNFFPLFTLHEIFVFSGVNLLITAVSLVLRYGSGLQSFLIVIAVILWILSSLMKFFASFAEPAIVISKTGVFQSISDSIKLVISYPWHIMFLLLLLLIISVRVFINLALIILIPGLVLGIGISLTYVLTPVISYTIAGIVAVALLGVAAYFFTYLHIFKQTVWTLMYMELVQQKAMDQIG